LFLFFRLDWVIFSYTILIVEVRGIGVMQNHYYTKLHFQVFGHF
jgi:hypothetical protein